MSEETSTRTQKVLFVITKSNWGGAQKYVYDLATELRRRNLDTMVAAGGYGEMLERLEAAGIPVYHLSKLRNNMNPLGSIAGFFQLVSLFRKEEPDVVHLNSSKAGLFGAMAARLSGVPHIIFTAHGWPFNEERPAWQRLLLRMLMKLTAALSHTTICVSNKMREDLRPGPRLSKKCRIVHNGISPIAFKPQTSFYEEFRCVRRERIAVVSIGELHPSKGFDLALSYLKDLQDLSWEWFILGEGKDRGKLDRAIREYGLSSRVHIMGHVKNASSYLKSFDLFFLPSRTEGLAYVALEALQTDLPIIASDVGGIPEVLGKDPGTTFISIRNSESATQALREKLEIFPKKVESSKREELRHEFSLERMVEETKKVYEN